MKECLVWLWYLRICVRFWCSSEELGLGLGLGFGAETENDDDDDILMGGMSFRRRRMLRWHG